MPVPTIDGELFSCAGFEWAGPSEKYPLGRWEAPQGAAKPGIAAVGGRVYCEHPTTEILTVSYDLVDGRGVRRWKPGERLPHDLMSHLQDPSAPIEAHNAGFERNWVELIAGPQHGWVVPDPTKWRCSMATALVAQRPAALGALTEVLGIAEQKDKEGDRLIKKFCIPQQPIPGLIDKKTGRVKRPDQPARRIFPHDDPEDFENLCLYCDRDVMAEMGAMAVVPHMEPHEVVAWQLTQLMNFRGMTIDTVGLEACIDMLGKVLAHYGAECERITGLKVTQLEKLKGWLAAYGVHTSSLDANSLEALLARPGLDPTARRVLELRERTGSASVKKIFGLKNHMGRGNRIRDMLIHHGTRPGRPTGADVQPLNLPKAGPKLTRCECGRPSKPGPSCPWCGEIKAPNGRKAWESAMVDDVVEIMRCGSLEMTEQFFGDTMTAIQGCVRGLFVAAEEHDLVSTDYSSLQAVVAACLAGEEWKVQAFRDRKPLYLISASKITGTPVEQYLQHAKDTGDHHPDRQAGKTAELALGFQGWINAWRAMEVQQGVDSGYDDQRLKDIILAWRKANPAIVEMWGGQWRGSPWRRERQELYGLEGMFIAAVQNPGQSFDYRGVGFCMEEKDCLVIRLPQIDGIRRALRYHEPRLTPSARNSDELSISYSTWNTNPNYGARGWVRMGTWGGRVFENCLAEGTEVLTDRGWVAIENVSSSDLVHDGIELVNHRGSVYKSVQDCLPVDGVWMTPDHEVLDDAQNWRAASSVRKLFRPEIRNASSRMRYAKAPFSTSHALDVYLRLRRRMRESYARRTKITEERSYSELRVFSRSVHRNEKHQTRNERASGVLDMAFHERQVPPAQSSIVAQLWRAGNFRVRSVATFFRGLLARHEADVLARCGLGPGKQRRPVFSAKLSMGFSTSKLEQPSFNPFFGNPLGSNADGGCRAKGGSGTPSAPLPTGPRLDDPGRPAAKRLQARKVYDILNCGPRQRFVVRGSSGPFIVHNCVMGVEVEIQRFGAKLMEKHGYPLVLSVYDENVAEIRKGKPLTLGLPPVEGLDPYVQEVEHLLAIMPPEIADWPIRAADGWRGRRYRKG